MIFIYSGLHYGVQFTRSLTIIMKYCYYIVYYICIIIKYCNCWITIMWTIVLARIMPMNCISEKKFLSIYLDNGERYPKKSVDNFLNLITKCSCLIALIKGYNYYLINCIRLVFVKMPCSLILLIRLAFV